MAKPKVRRRKQDKKKPPILLFVVIAVVIVGALIALWQAQTAPEGLGTTAGIVVDFNGRNMLGTAFIVETDSGKKICTIQHIGMYNISQISSEFNVTGPFTLTGTQEAPEATLCAPVSTTWNGFEFLDTIVPPGTQLRVFTTQRQSFAISAREYSYAEGNLGGGTALYASGTTIIHESMSGSPVVLESDQSQVVGILMGGSSQDIFIAPYRDLR